MSEARTRAYEVLGAAVLNGIDPADLDWVRSVPSLAAAVEALSREVPLEDALAAAHHAVLLHGVPPHASVFVHTEGRLGGVIAQRAVEDLRALGLDALADDDVNADHLGTWLLALAFLGANELDARAAGDREAIERLALLQRVLIDRYLLSWMAPLVLAVRAEGNALYAGLLDLAHELVTEHRRSYPEPSGEVVVESPPLPDADAGLSEVASALVTPARCGLWLSQHALGEIAATVGLPIGPAARRKRVLDLFEGAASYEKLGPFLDVLHSRFARAAEDHAALSASAWQAKAEATREWVRTLRKAAISP